MPFNQLLDLCSSFQLKAMRQLSLKNAQLSLSICAVISQFQYLTCHPLWFIFAQFVLQLAEITGTLLE